MSRFVKVLTLVTILVMVFSHAVSASSVLSEHYVFDETDLLNAIKLIKVGDKHVIYLLSDFSLSGVITVPTGVDVELRADSPVTVTTTGAFRHFLVRGSLTIDGDITLKN